MHFWVFWLFFFNCGKHNAFPCLYMRSLSYQSQKRQTVLRSTIRNQYHGTQVRSTQTFVFPGSGAWGPWWMRKSPSTCRQQCWLAAAGTCTLDGNASILLPAPSYDHLSIRGLGALPGDFTDSVTRLPRAAQRLCLLTVLGDKTWNKSMILSLLYTHLKI